MSFIFATSHLPETRVRRPDHLEEEDDEEVMQQPAPRAGGVRAFSHLPAKKETEDRTAGDSLRREISLIPPHSAAPTSPAPSRMRDQDDPPPPEQPLGRQFQRSEPGDTSTPHADGIAAAKASGVFDVVRQQINRDGSPHFMDEAGNLRPRDEARQQDSPAPRDARTPQFGAEAPPRPVRSAGKAAAADAYSSRSPRAPSSASEDTRPWHAPAITPEDLDPQHFDDADDDDGSHFAPKGRPGAHDLVHRIHGESQPKSGFQDLLYRFSGSPEEAKDHHSDYIHNVADAQGAVPVLHFTPATPGTSRGSGPQSGIASDLDWANANPQKKEPLFPDSAERRMTEQERSLAEIGENANLDSLHELHEWNKAINEGRPVEDKPKPNPPLLPRRFSSPQTETADQNRENNTGSAAKPGDVDKASPTTASNNSKSPSRDEMILGSLPGNVQLKPNPAAKSDAPRNEFSGIGIGAVAHYDEDIAYAARIKGIDPDLIRAIMYVEMSHGWYDPSGLGVPYSLLPIVKSILPMNVNANYWGGAFGSKAELSVGRINVVSGAEMLRRLQKMAPGAGIAEIATLYNNHRADKVNDYGARVAQIYKDKPWEVLTKPLHEKKGQK